MRRFLILLVFVLFTGFTLQAEARNLALLVGVDHYDSLPSLPFCVNDSKALKEALMKVGFLESDIRMLVTGGTVQEMPTRNNIEQKFKDIFTTAGPEDLIFIAFSGHGVQIREEVWFCPPFVDPKNIEETCVPIYKMMDDLAACKARFKWVVMDACQIAEARSATSNNSGSSGYRTTPVIPEGIVLFQSCAPGEVSYDDFASKCGFFTKNLVAAISGEADTNHDGDLTLMEICTWTSKQTHEQVLAAVNQNQRPYVLGSFSDFTFTQNLNLSKANALAAEGQELIEQKKYEEGIRKLDEAIALYPNFKSWKRERTLAQQLLEVDSNANQGSSEEDLKQKAEKLYQLGVKWETADHGKGSQDWNLAAKYYRQAAELGHARAMALLGNCYYCGNGVKKNTQKMLQWIRKAADLNDPLAYMLLAECYEFGIGVPENQEMEQRWDSKCYYTCNSQKDSNDPVIQWLLGFYYFTGKVVAKDEKEAVRHFRKAADLGCAQGMVELGVCYELGLGVEKDDTEAMRWYKLAAQQEYTGAQFHLGFSYEKGIGVEKDAEKAVYWYRKAAEQKDATAQCQLGVCYFNGIGVEKDEKEAVRWYRKAAEQEGGGTGRPAGTGLFGDLFLKRYWCKGKRKRGRTLVQNGRRTWISSGTAAFGGLL